MNRGHFFVVALLLTIGVAWLAPGLGHTGGPLSLSSLTRVGVAVIFFFYGAALSRDDLRAGLIHWRLHLVIQTTTFLVFPLLILGELTLLRPFFGDASPLRTGLFFLATLPTTVSSSVVLVALAGGHVAAAVVSTTCSSLLGIVLTPLWLAAFLSASGESLTILDKVIGTTLLILVPTLLGLAASTWIGRWVVRHRSKLRLFDQSVVLLIVYCAFADAFQERVLGALTPSLFAMVIVVALATLGTVFGGIGLVCRAIGLNARDTITAQICGSQKSIMHGTVMGQILFAGTPLAPVLGLVLLPMMIYHALQLIVTGMLIGKNREP